jgi:hypothetical protein
MMQRKISPWALTTPVQCLLVITFSLVMLASTARASFTDVTATALPMPTMSSGQSPILDGGATTGDFDGDGDIDIIVPTRDDRDLYFRNNGDGTFSEIGEQVGFTAVTDGRSAAAADIDDDGDLDVYVAAFIEPGHYLYINNGSGFFTEEAALRGAAIPGGQRHGRGVAFGDYDNDGYLDLFVAEWLEPWAPLGTTGPVGRLLRNRGALQPGYFDDVTISAGVVQNGIVGRRSGVFAHTPRFTDLDRDGWPDLVIASDFSESRLYWNNGDGTFTDGTVASGFGTGRSEMGMDTADINGDGLLDIVTTSIFLDQNADGIADNHLDGNRLYINNGDRTFSDATEAAGIRNGYWGWGVVALDYDNDSDLDLFQTNGFFHTECPACEDDFPEGVDWVALYEHDPTLLFQNDGNSTFTEIALASGIVSNEWSIGVIAFDYDGDGDQDVLQINRDTDPDLFRNDTISNNDWLQIRLASNGSAPNGIGAYVTVTPTAGGPSQTREVSASGTWMAQDGSGVLYFGFGDLPSGSTVDVQIDWPSGTQTFHAAQALNQKVTYEDGLPAIEVGQGLLVVGGDGDGPHIAGSEVIVTADPADAHYHFAYWSSNGGGVFADPYSAQTTFTVPDGATVVTVKYLPGVAPDASVGVARRWNEVLMQAIRKDFARPTIHARNLFHISAAMYDAWAAFADQEDTWLLGHSRASVDCPFDAMPTPVDVEAARREAISHAAYRLLLHRFVASPGVSTAYRDAHALIAYLGYDGTDDSTDYAAGSAAALGNYIAQCYIDFGYADGANEAQEFDNRSYQPVNAALQPELPGNPDISDLNRWQPLSLVQFVDQSGNQVSSAPAFLGPEWGEVVPFALRAEDRVDYQRDGFDYLVYHDPGAPPTIDGSLSDSYKWAFSLVSIWSSHLDPSDGVMMDISPASIGNIQSFPTQFENYPQFYNTLAGGDASVGYPVNPVTGEPYTPQIVPRGDYARVLAEFWADGPDSETPPGHWFVILNEVSDHPLLSRRFGGTGPELEILEWEVKSYFTLGGAMHDAAVSAWGVKGWYDYIRPISALRAMADLGQSSDPLLPSFHESGIPLQPGYIELVAGGDPLAGTFGEHIGKIKVFAWRGPDYIVDPATDEAGVGWILAENWWPYQRPTFVTPPFAGYVSGHSTFSRAAAEVMTALTGDSYFPGGMSSFEIPRNEFLVFEEGPSVDMTLEWATYRDASDQCSLSRIWGGIHPPLDDLAGRLMGIDIGLDAFNLASEMFNGNVPPTVNLAAPLNGNSYNWRDNIELTATASDADGSVTRVEFYQGSTLLGEDNTAPYTFTWISPAGGNYTLIAVAIDDSGASTSSMAVGVTVNWNIPGC